MSIENFKKFGQLCAEDKTIREKVKAIGIENIDGWIAYANKDLGLEFTKDDMKAMAKDVGPQEELSEEQLEQVAGGFITTTALAVAGMVAGVAGGIGAFAGGIAALGSAARRW